MPPSELRLALLFHVGLAGSLVVGAACTAQQDLGNRLDAGERCAIGLTECAGACVDLLSDPKHCGACGAACAPGQVCGPSGNFPAVVGPSACSSVCPSGLTNCDGACVSFLVNSAHCGACGNLCPAGMHCQGGYCDSCPVDAEFCLFKDTVGHSGGCVLPGTMVGDICQ